MKKTFCIEFTDLSDNAQKALFGETAKFMPGYDETVAYNWLIDSALHVINLPELASQIMKDTDKE